jgi:hypothetical protein
VQIQYWLVNKYQKRQNKGCDASLALIIRINFTKYQIYVFLAHYCIWQFLHMKCFLLPAILPLFCTYAHHDKIITIQWFCYVVFNSHMFNYVNGVSI